SNAQQLSVLGSLSPAQKVEFFAYLPEEEQGNVLKGAGDAERAALLAKKAEREKRRNDNQDDPARTPPPANETLRKAVSEYPGADKKAVRTWQGFLVAYNKWNSTRAEQARLEGSPNVALISYLEGLLGGPLLNTAIHRFDSGAGDLADATSGEITLRVTDPIGDIAGVDGDDYKIIVPAPAPGVPGAEFIAPLKERIAKSLAPLKGRLWECKRIETYINDYFIRGRSGYERTPEAANALDVCNQGSPGLAKEPKLIKVPYVPHIGRIEFRGHVDGKDKRIALREILTDKEFETYRRHPEMLTDCEDTSAGRPANQGAAAGGAQPSGTPGEREAQVECKQIKYQDLSGVADELPYLNLNNWRLEQAGLKEKGFASAVDSFEPAPPPNAGGEASDEGGGDTDAELEKIAPHFVRIILVKSDAGNKSIIKNIDEPSGAEGKPAGGNAAAPSASPAATPGGSPTPGSAAPAQQTKPKLNAKATSTKRKPPVSKPRNNFVGGELVYRPGRGFRGYGLYSRKITGKDDFSVRVGGDAGALVSGEYESQDLFRDRFYHTFPFGVQGYTDTTAKRILNGVQLDERRTGGVFRVATQLKTRPTTLTLFLEARRETVELVREDVVAQKQNLTTLSFGGLYAGSTKGVNNTRWQVEPTLRLGLGLDGQPGFAVMNVTGLLHRSMSGDRDLILDGRVDVASEGTPLFEQPSFGSEETVRGFRADDAIGLRQWALKTEFQAPVPGTSPDAEGLARLVRTLKLAGFLDVGGIYRTTGSAPGVRLGPGVGLRVNYGGADLGLSWAYGIGDAAAGRGHGRFYFSVSRELPRFIR
ncbi:MAG: BamA/TamA family outer membrane protein, partial [Pyrinomonadaceae bacterium]